MASSASLLGLPAEIVEEIVLLCAFTDVCNLRLASREAAYKSSEASFKVGFLTKSVALCPPDLERFVTVTKTGWLGCALTDLTIVGTPSVANGEASELQQEKECIALLTKAFEQVIANSRSGRLRTLSLTVSETTSTPVSNMGYTHGWHHIWHCAAATSRVVASGLHASGLRIERLDAYGPVGRCALSSGCLRTLFDSFNLNQLKSLTLAVSTDDSDCVASNGYDLGQILHKTIGHLHSLEHLDLRWFNLSLDNLEDARSRDRHAFAKLATLPISSLGSLVLRGVRTSSKDLLAVLTRHPQLRRLHLEGLTLEEGLFGSIFAYITSQLELESLYLDDLMESRLIKFIGSTGERHFPHAGPPTWIERVGSETKEYIIYRSFRERIKCSPQSNRWARRRKHLYGPVERSEYLRTRSNIIR